MISLTAYYLIIAGIVVAQLILVSVWLHLDPLQPILYTDADQVWVMFDPDAKYLWIPGLLPVICMSVCVHLAFKTRNVPTDFEESKVIAMIAYFLTIGLIILAPLMLMLRDKRVFDVFGGIFLFLVIVFCKLIYYDNRLERIFVKTKNMVFIETIQQRNNANQQRPVQRSISNSKAVAKCTFCKQEISNNCPLELRNQALTALRKCEQSNY